MELQHEDGCVTGCRLASDPNEVRVVEVCGDQISGRSSWSNVQRLSNVHADGSPK